MSVFFLLTILNFIGLFCGKDTKNIRLFLGIIKKITYLCKTILIIIPKIYGQTIDNHTMLFTINR